MAGEDTERRSSRRESSKRRESKRDLTEDEGDDKDHKHKSRHSKRRSSTTDRDKDRKRSSTRKSSSKTNDRSKSRDRKSREISDSSSTKATTHKKRASSVEKDKNYRHSRKSSKNLEDAAREATMALEEPERRRSSSLENRPSPPIEEAPKTVSAPSTATAAVPSTHTPQDASNRSGPSAPQSSPPRQADPPAAVTPLSATTAAPRSTPPPPVTSTPSFAPQPLTPNASTPPEPSAMSRPSPPPQGTPTSVGALRQKLEAAAASSRAAAAGQAPPSPSKVPVVAAPKPSPPPAPRQPDPAPSSLQSVGQLRQKLEEAAATSRAAAAKAPPPAPVAVTAEWQQLLQEANLVPTSTPALGMMAQPTSTQSTPARPTQELFVSNTHSASTTPARPSVGQLRQQMELGASSRNVPTPSTGYQTSSNRNLVGPPSPIRHTTASAPWVVPESMQQRSQRFEEIAKKHEQPPPLETSMDTDAAVAPTPSRPSVKEIGERFDSVAEASYNELRRSHSTRDHDSDRRSGLHRESSRRERSNALEETPDRRDRRSEERDSDRRDSRSRDHTLDRRESRREMDRRESRRDLDRRESSRRDDHERDYDRGRSHRHLDKQKSKRKNDTEKTLVTSTTADNTLDMQVAEQVDVTNDKDGKKKRKRKSKRESRTTCRGPVMCLIVCLLLLGVLGVGAWMWLRMRNVRAKGSAFQLPEDDVVNPAEDDDDTRLPTPSHSPDLLPPATLPPTLPPTTPNPTVEPGMPTVAPSKIPTIQPTVAASNGPTSPPSAIPTAAPTTQSGWIGNIIFGIARFGGEEFNRPDTYQRKAMEWILVEGNNIAMAATNELPFEDLVVQLYALACTYYATYQVPNDVTNVLLDSPEVGPWTNSDRWMMSGTNGGCDWYGVICSRTGRVEKISLPNNGLTGHVPPELALLKDSLLYLDLFNNDVHNVGGNGNSFLGEMTNLMYLYLGQTFFEHDGIPSELSNLKRLVELDISFTSWFGPLKSEPWSEFQRLEYLVMNGNVFNTTLPDSLVELPNLQYLYVVDSFLKGDLEWVSRMPAIRELWIDNNPLATRIPDSLSRVSTLASFSAGNCGLIGPIPASLGDLADSMTHLWLNDNALTMTIPEDLSRLSNLQTLSLMGNGFIGGVPEEICRQKALVGNLQTVEVDSSIPCECCSCCGHQSISVQGAGIGTR